MPIWNGPPGGTVTLQLAGPVSFHEGTVEVRGGRSRRVVHVSRENLARVGASPLLCIEPSILGGHIPILAYEPGDEEPLEQAPPNETAAPKKVGVVRVEGPLAQRAVSDICGYVDGYDAVARRFHAALTMEDVGSVLLVIDSPGGDVAGLEQAVERMKAAKSDAGKPVVAFVDEMAASAAYWIAAAVADEIVIPPAGRVGSIGCIGAFADESKAYENEGITWHVAREPAGKADMMPLAPVTDLAKERLATQVKAVADRFYEAIAAARDGVNVKQCKTLNGCVLEGPDAVEAKLVDRVGSFDVAVERAADMGRPVAKTEAPSAPLKTQDDPRVAHAIATNLFAMVAARGRKSPTST